jgi:hypothetical protein
MKFGTGLAYGFAVLAIISLLLSGCDRLQKGADSGFGEMATGVMQQASAQGLQIDPASKEALALLIRVYLVRGDLHRAFGEPEKLNLSALVQWAAGPAVTVDYNKNKLAPYAKTFASLASQMGNRPLVYVALQ